MARTVDPADPGGAASARPHQERPPILRLRTVVSTQDEASRRLTAGRRPPFAVTARQQTSGRGRLGRAFVSPDGASLSFTYVHRTAVGPAERGWIPLAAGLAAVTALSREAGPAIEGEIGLKWPNDLHTPEGRKLGGILVEGRGPDVVLVGIGLNLRGPVIGPDGAQVPGATWLRGEGGLLPEHDGAASDQDLREGLETALATALSEELDRLESAGGDGVRAGTHHRYTMTCLTLGRRVRVDPLGAQGRGSSRTWSGASRAIDGQGRLVVDLDGGGQQAVDVGDVRHLRPEGSAGATAHQTRDIEQEEHVT